MDVYIQEIQRTEPYVTAAVNFISEFILKMKTVFLCGVGKSSHVARKCVATWQSLGLRCHPLNVQDLSHGDLGILEPGDCIIYISNSGNTEEIIQISKYIQTRFQVVQVALIASAKSPLEAYVNSVVSISPVTIEEADPWHTVPSVSTVLFMMTLDLVGIRVAELNGFTKQQFQLCHPGGSLGKDKTSEMNSTMEVYYDGVNVAKYGSKATGFTTNCSIFKDSPFKVYRDFYDDNKDVIGSKPISFQIWESEYDKAVQQIQDIHYIGPNVFVKIPIVNHIGQTNDNLIQFAVSGNFPINITAIYTLDQIDKAYEMLEDSDVEAIVSVFAGSISDKFLDPHHAITYALKRFKDKPNVKILWAGCREVYAIQRAKDANCHIITVPDAIMDKLDNQKSLHELSVERVSKFREDALSGNLSIK